MASDGEKPKPKSKWPKDTALVAVVAYSALGGLRGTVKAAAATAVVLTTAEDAMTTVNDLLNGNWGTGFDISDSPAGTPDVRKALPYEYWYYLTWFSIAEVAQAHFVKYSRWSWQPSDQLRSCDFP